jgi:hypothetical protein
MGFFSGLDKGYKEFTRQFEAASEVIGGCLGWLFPWSLVAAVILVLIFLIQGQCRGESRQDGPGQAQVPSGLTIYEAEQASLNGAAQLCTDHSGFSGTAFVCGYGPEGVGSSATTFRVQVPSTGAFVVSLRYANSNSQAMTLSIYVNGVKVKVTVLQPLPTWDSWSEQDEVLTLVSGINEVSYHYDLNDSGHVNLDRIQIGPR